MRAGQGSPSTRPPVERKIGNDARTAAAHLVVAERRMARYQREADAERAKLDAIHRAAEERFGFYLPLDPQLLDVLASVEIRADGYWHWAGLRNNKGLATIRVRGREDSEQSVVRYLAIAFGVIAPDEHGTLYPANGVDDVNPWHRTIRVTSGQPTGNPNRYRNLKVDPATFKALKVEADAAGLSVQVRAFVVEHLEPMEARSRGIGAGG